MYEKLAMDLMFAQVVVANLGTTYGLQFRKGKTVEDLKKARVKARKNGQGRTEFELDMLEVYLKLVMKGV